jgi:hypothetical protein
MPKKTSNNDANALHLEDQIHGAMQQEGWSIPTTPQAVLLMESRLAKAKPKLPASLAADPISLLKAPAKSIELRPCASVENPALLENLARAARDAGELSPEIEEKMQRDREFAEKDDTK